jgi:hypothetical protein
MDMTVVQASRVHVGDRKDVFAGTPEGDLKDDVHASFTTPPFSCPHIERSAVALLIFESFNVEFQNTLKVNGNLIKKGILVNCQIDSKQFWWTGQNILIPQNILNETGNTITFEANNDRGNQDGGDLDDFIIDNVVVLYKTR